MTKSILTLALLAGLAISCTKKEKPETTEMMTEKTADSSSIASTKTDSISAGSESKETATTQTGNQWFVGKKLVNNLPVSNKPEEGGPDFMVVNTNNTADYKVGDIVEQTTYEVKGNQLILKSQMTDSKIIFTIEKDYLIDQNGTKWVVGK